MQETSATLGGMPVSGRHDGQEDRPSSAFDRAVAAVRSGADPRAEAEGLYDQLTDEERLGLLDGDTPFWSGIAEMSARYNARAYVHGQVERLGIPGTRFVDGPRGCVAGEGTAFPASMARGATWDVDLEERVGAAIGREVRAQGGNFFGGVCVNLPRHPAWGRVQETYGDDSFHLGEFGAALTRGVQANAMACVKHYALNSMENARFHVDVTVDQVTLHEIYLPHFKRALAEGASAVMTAYNSVNGEWCGQNPYLLTEVLRDLWAWDGITVSDFVWGLRDAAASLNAGLDIEEPFVQMRAAHLPRQLEAGETSWAMVERAGLRILAVQLRHYAQRLDAEPTTAVMACLEHRALAREVAGRAMVLLKNDAVDGVPVLPIAPGPVRLVAVIGRLVTAPNMGDHGSSDVHSPDHVTPLDGLRSAYPDADFLVVDDDDPEAAARAAMEADVAIVVAGFDSRDEGEYVGGDTMSDPTLLAVFPPLPEDSPFAAAFRQMASAEDEESLQGTEDALNAAVPGQTLMTDGMGGDRTSLRLRPVDERIITAVAAANARTVVAIVAAGAVITEAWRHDVPGIVMMWYAGMEGGHALADVLTGRRNPSGRLPYSMPRSDAHLPDFVKDATAVTYDRWHGQRLLDRVGVEAAYPHGFGLSYTRFALGDASVEDVTPDGAVVTVSVANIGDRDGHHVVQVYGRCEEGPRSGETTVVGFVAVEVRAGETVRVTVPVSFAPLSSWAAEQRRFVAPQGSVVLEVAAHAHDAAAQILRLGL